MIPMGFTAIYIYGDYILRLVGGNGVLDEGPTHTKLGGEDQMRVIPVVVISICTV